MERTSDERPKIGSSPKFALSISLSRSRPGFPRAFASFASSPHSSLSSPNSTSAKSFVHAGRVYGGAIIITAPPTIRRRRRRRRTAAARAPVVRDARARDFDASHAAEIACLPRGLLSTSGGKSPTRPILLLRHREVKVPTAGDVRANGDRTWRCPLGPGLTAKVSVDFGVPLWDFFQRVFVLGLGLDGRGSDSAAPLLRPHHGDTCRAPVGWRPRIGAPRRLRVGGGPHVGLPTRERQKDLSWLARFLGGGVVSSSGLFSFFLFSSYPLLFLVATLCGSRVRL
ncbi:hypothetical protein NL676_026442 [Syzygium grande]|nr:hypothetical protein NL676_026442 [Syzygium grande]